MTGYEHDIIQPTDRTPPFPRFSLVCAFTGCKARYVLPSPNLPAEVIASPNRAVWAAWQLPPVSKIGELAALDGWSRHPQTGAHLCPAHPYGTPVAELESHEAVQVRTDTAALPVEEIQAALAEEGDTTS